MKGYRAALGLCLYQEGDCQLSRRHLFHVICYVIVIYKIDKPRLWSSINDAVDDWGLLDLGLTEKAHLLSTSQHAVGKAPGNPKLNERAVLAGQRLCSLGVRMSHGCRCKDNRLCGVQHLVIQLDALDAAREAGLQVLDLRGDL